MCVRVFAGVSEVLSRGAAQSDVAGSDRSSGVDPGLHQGLAGGSTLPKREREAKQRGNYHSVRFL